MLRLKPPTFPAARDMVLLVLGLVLLGHETLAVPEPRVVLITVAVGMIGLPATLLADRRFVSSSPSPSESSPPEPPPGPAPGPPTSAPQPRP